MKLYETGVLILLLLLTIVMIDQSLCLSCTFELPDASSDADPEGDCSLCLTLAQPAEPALFPIELDSNEAQSRMAASVPDSFLPPVFRPPQPFVGP